MPVPDFSPGEVLTAAAMDSIGLWLVKTQTVGTAVSSVTVTGAFSADYDNYVITLSGGAATGNNGLTLQLGATVTGYRYAFLHSGYSGGALNAGSTTATAFSYTGTSSNPSASAYITVQNPFLAQHTYIQSSTAADVFAGLTSGVMANTTSYTSFNLGTLAGTLTGGTIRVYGYRN